MLGAEHVKALAAPVPSDPQYGGRPVYSSVLVVRKAGGVRSAEGLRGGTIAYNDVSSLSGYHVVRHWLATQPNAGALFSAWLCSGSHERSLEMVATGRATCAAVDSIVVERLRETRPELLHAVRVLSDVRLATSPSQPVVVRRSLAERAQEDIAEALQAVAATDFRFVARLVRVTDDHYRPTRDLLALANSLPRMPLVSPHAAAAAGNDSTIPNSPGRMDWTTRLAGALGPTAMDESSGWL